MTPAAADTYDLAVVGSGFAGSLTAMIARRLGRRVALLERGRHPRFAIGESSTPLANLLWEHLARRYDLPRLAPLAKWGTWQATYPSLGCGLKRGFTFYHHRAGEPLAPRPDRANELLVAASPNDRIADTHWYRADVDHFLVNEARAAGVDYFDEVALDAPRLSAGVTELTGTRDGRQVNFRAKFLIDATGPRGFLHRSLGLRESRVPHMPATRALYSHFTGVAASPQPADAPYPPHAAAVHHVFDGGWAWVLRFNNGITSAGVAMTDAAAAAIRLDEGEPAWHRLLHRYPSLAHDFHAASHVRPFTYVPQLAFRSDTVTGPGWALLPSAAGFVDPLLSTGFPLTLLGVERLALALEATNDAPHLDDYARHTLAELDATTHLITALYAAMADFPTFANLTMFYFAAASYAESARRLDRPHLARSFLLHDHPTFGPAMRACCDRVLCMPPAAWPDADRAAFAEEVRRAIDPINVAGLANPAARHWYPVNLADLRDNAAKLGATPAEVDEVWRRDVTDGPRPLN